MRSSPGFPKKLWGLLVCDFSQARCPSCHLTTVSKHYKKIQSSRRVLNSGYWHLRAGERLGNSDVVLGLGPWLSLRTIWQSLVLSLALRVWSLVLALALKDSPCLSPWSWFLFVRILLNFWLWYNTITFSFWCKMNGIFTYLT